MFRAAPMARVTLWFLTSEAQDAALYLARHGAFAPAPPEVGLPETPTANYREVFLQAQSRLEKLLEHAHAPMPPVQEDAVAPTLPVLQAVNEELKTLWQDFSGVADRAEQIREEQRRLGVMRESFARLQGLHVDLSRLFHPDSLLDVRIGVIPAGNLQRLRESLGLAGFVLAVFDQHEGQSFAVAAGPQGGNIGGLLSQAGWRDMVIPAELRTQPEAARHYLQEQGEHLQAALAANQHMLADLLQRQGERVREARVQVALARPLAEAAQIGVRGRGQLTVFSGWVPRAGLGALLETLEERFHGRYLSDIRYPDRTQAAKVPTLVSYPAWLRPFAPLVRSYGLPRYGEFDPTLPFALGYLLLFGAMFGDVGHGAVLALLSLALGRRLRQFRWVGLAAGLASMLFGSLYGSVFGYEDLLPGLWLSPMRDPVHLLTVAVALGAGFIVLTLLANIYNRLVQGHLAAALGASNGLAGLVFYLGALAGGASMAGWADCGLAASLLAVAGLAGVAVYTGMETRAPWSERLLVTAIETLETGIKLFANTLSFMRVAAFSINHVALAMAVFALAGGLGSVGHGIALLLGNGIIIVLEGGIVAIQAMRLMYYEGFSRFFSGDGMEFVPLRLVSSEQ
jgi:V/A-type H+-transporting ATPase subunit I